MRTFLLILFSSPTFQEMLQRKGWRGKNVRDLTYLSFTHPLLIFFWGCVGNERRIGEIRYKMLWMERISA